MLDGVPGRLLAKRWGVPHAEWAATLGSTLDVVHTLGARGTDEGAVVVCDTQTAGRGRDGRTWSSPIGGVWLGMLFRPPHVELGAASIRAGLVIADVIDELLGRPATTVKWPNDVLVDGRKIAGVLCEGRWQGADLQWLAVGVGLNVCNDIPDALRTRAIALQEVLPGVRRLEVLDRLVPGLRRLTGHATALSDAECAAFAARDWLRGRSLARPLTGRGGGVRSDGALLVEGERGTTAVREGHVELA